MKRYKVFFTESQTKFQSSCQGQLTHRFWRSLLLVLLFWLAADTDPVFPENPFPPTLPSLTLKAEDRLLVLAPHPDDETLNCGGLIQEAVSLKIPVRIVFFTYGESNQWAFLVSRKHPVLFPPEVRLMGETRRREALKAGKVFNLPENSLIFLGYPDAGTLKIWEEHWADQPPAAGLLSRARAVPYATAFRPGAAYKGEEILRDLEAIIKEFQPTKIFVSHPLDWHPDHRSLYLFSLVSLWDLKSPAEIFPYLTHFPKWPVPPGYRPQLALLPPGRTETDLQWCQLPLTGEQVFRKTAALKQHRSQYRSHRGYLLSFMRTNELFGNLPPVLLREGQPPVLVLTRTAAEMEELAAKSEQGVEHSILLKEKLISLEKEHLVLTIRLSRPLAREIFATIHLFGYRADRPFSEMPKIRLKLGPVHHHVFSLGRALPDDSVLVKRENSLFVLKIPLKLLGEPERIFTDYATETENYFLERLAWRVIIVTKR